MREESYPRVLHVIGSLAIGGTERQLVEFIRRSSAPAEHRVAVFDEPGPLAEELIVEPIDLGRIRSRLGSTASNAATARALRRAVREERVDLVHAHLGFSEVLCLVVPRRIPVIASRRGRNISFQNHAYLKLVEGLGHRKTDLMLCNSQELARSTRIHDLWPPPIEVIHNGVDLERFHPMPPEASLDPTVVLVANMRHYKGHERFLHAFRQVRARMAGAKAILVGDGPERGRLMSMIFEFGLADCVDFVGQVDDPRPFIAQSHVACLTSSHEGFPNALLESMAMGRPVVATRAGGIPELVRDGVDGLLTSLLPADIARAIVMLLRDESLRARMGAAARQRAEDFDWDRVVRETEAAYRRVLRDRSRRSATAHGHRDR